MVGLLVLPLAAAAAVDVFDSHDSFSPNVSEEPIQMRQVVAGASFSVAVFSVIVFVVVVLLLPRSNLIINCPYRKERK